jgi:predicted membrane-bound spermidine synthase
MLGVRLLFMLAEIALVQRFMVFLGHPTRGLSVVLASLLLASGVGSLASTRIRDADLVAAVQRRVVGIVSLLAGAAIALPPALAAAIGLSEGTRVAIAVACVSPVGAALGVCVPLGVRLLGRSGQADWVPATWFVIAVTSHAPKADFTPVSRHAR